MAGKPNLKRKKPVKFEPLIGERGKKLLQDIAPEDIASGKNEIKIFLDLEEEILDSGKTENPEAEYLKNIEEVELKEKNINYRIKLMPDVIESD